MSLDKRTGACRLHGTTRRAARCTGAELEIGETVVAKTQFMADDSLQCSAAIGLACPDANRANGHQSRPTASGIIGHEYTATDMVCRQENGLEMHAYPLCTLVILDGPIQTDPTAVTGTSAAKTTSSSAQGGDVAGMQFPAVVQSSQF